MTESQDDSKPEYCLRAVTGPLAGKSWHLTEPVSLIGRNLGCHVRIDDTHVSRVQCELIAAPYGIHMRNIGQRNPTRINNVSREEAHLQPGDVLSFAGLSFIVEQADGPEPRGLHMPENNRTTQSFADVIHLRAEFDEQAYARDTQLTGDLHRLLGLLRSLGRATSLESLCQTLTEHLKERLQADEVWLAWRLHPQEELVLFPPAAPEKNRKAPFQLMRDACITAAGIMITAASTYDRSDRRTMAAPLLHGGQCFGAVAVGRTLALPGYTESDLQHLTAVAECSAPLIRGAERMEQLQRDSGSNPEGTVPPATLLSASHSMQRVHTEIRRAAITFGHVILQGETGAGKELAARMNHNLSARANGPYIVVNCAAIAPELFESELFGHERGAFTGALRRRRGFFELAHGGTLFLDEIGELSLTNQATLLRAVETGRFRPVGGESEIQVDVRIICATNRMLPDVKQTYFRTDLYHRLAGYIVTIPPLREHREDIPDLARHFLRASAPKAPAHPKEFTKEAMDKLVAYDWPGNVRELRNVVERACFSTQAAFVSSDDIHVDRPEASTAIPTGTVSVEEFERQQLIDALRQNDNSASKAAKALGIPRSTMYYKLSYHGIKPRTMTH